MATRESGLKASQLPESYFTWPGVLGRLGRGEELSESQVQWAVQRIMEGQSTDAQIAAFAFGLRVRGITAAELAAAAATMKDFATPLPQADPSEGGNGARDSVDIVGTGGDGHHTVNISTMGSFVVAATGVPVVKHGNRAASSKCGGADMLEALGLDIERSPETVAKDIARTNFAFMYAKTYHPAMRFAAGVRSELGVPTLFNLLGPMTNPASPKYGLIGCAFKEFMPIMGGAFAHQGSRVLVVRGMDGMDEISVCTPTEVVAVSENGTAIEEIINPRSIGLDFHPEGSLAGGDAEYNAEVARALARNEVTGAIRDAVLINAAGALSAYHGWAEQGLEATMRHYVAVAQDALESGAVARQLELVLD